MSTRGILALCVILTSLGWIGLASFTYYNPPDIWNRWIVVVALWPTLLTTFLPMIYVIHWRSERWKGNMSQVARRSALAALFVTLCIALQITQAMNWAKVVLLLLLLVLAEGYWSAKEKEA